MYNAIKRRVFVGKSLDANENLLIVELIEETKPGNTSYSGLYPGVIITAFLVVEERIQPKVPL